MDSKFYYYIVIGGLYYGFKIWQNYKKNQAAKLAELEKRQGYSENAPVFQPVSKPKTKLEELLQEFGMDTYEQPETTQRYQQPETSVDYNQREESVSYEDPNAKSPFENKGLMPEDYFNASSKDMKTNQNMERLIDKSRFQGYRSQDMIARGTDTLRTKKGLRNALIVSEILKAKF